MRPPLRWPRKHLQAMPAAISFTALGISGLKLEFVLMTGKQQGLDLGSSQGTKSVDGLNSSQVPLGQLQGREIACLSSLE